ncbi:protein COFACTOR ASSEMBLY OF COMPLEX C SUBUNIT B CCB2, chloroplastic isoform X2 [Phalaenopsis equestris]|uniref:protein COFACTOR ASSEMBLY OF COMPLEX C SUBUNIT B CCB2, chloroplastic isoform X2 n=1 Tax=Phalaenopsis equestris TaxID=78828 RepID=UPI0009E247B5|nr:protein COFACTOR ASSEMBLY OF COMPLEX C SUBUNIT B CCB2, chloroplastic isoform X2 [Phalaenopsis equestris]
MLSSCHRTHSSSAPKPVCISSSSHLFERTVRFWTNSHLHGGGGARIHCRRFCVFAAQDRNLQGDRQLKLSVLRFTLGIPGLDESYLPRWIGVAFGSLILLNHYLSSSPGPAQLRSEAMGLCLAAFSTTLPYVGKFLKGENPVDRSNLPDGNKQIFIMSENLLDSQREDFAWASYVLLRNTNSMSVLIAVRDAACVRGYWNMPEGISKAQMVKWLLTKFEEVGLLDLKDTLYFPERPDSELQPMLPRGTLSLLLQPVLSESSALVDTRTNIEGFVLLASNANYAYSEKDRAWIRAISNKFKDSDIGHMEKDSFNIFPFSPTMSTLTTMPRLHLVICYGSFYNVDAIR